MARFFTQSLQLRPHLAIRSFSTRSAQLFEIEINPSTSSSSSEGESEALMLKKLDDIVQRILVQKATPDWLPFVPGSSFWVPPRRSPLGVNGFVGRLADKLSDEESLSVATDRGWPCSDYLINGSESVGTKEVDEDAEGSGEVEVVEVDLKVLTTNFEDE
ncbi:PREDICTED: uncharacterized protein LOC101293475 [Fragaria vesca subsp. vesca]|uniref:uncharacterized protein LOC101293475 n=1 Tax=Fragaria vesca subsp. vesca TaxID=101020 RepID=UPI0002C31D30|nr:PREDICTED: uncharacterized protein LOC101293475 [Fragaria vesca subsp. vesca]